MPNRRRERNRRRSWLLNRWKFGFKPILKLMPKMLTYLEKLRILFFFITQLIQMFSLRAVFISLSITPIGTIYMK